MGLSNGNILEVNVGFNTVSDEVFQKIATFTEIFSKSISRESFLIESPKIVVERVDLSFGLRHEAVLHDFIFLIAEPSKWSTDISQF